jgi:hypothetical protein
LFLATAINGSWTSSITFWVLTAAAAAASSGYPCQRGHQWLADFAYGHTMSCVSSCQLLMLMLLAGTHCQVHGFQLQLVGNCMLLLLIGSICGCIAEGAQLMQQPKVVCK